MGWLEAFVLGEEEMKRKRQIKLADYYERLKKKEEKLLKETGHGLLYRGGERNHRQITKASYFQMREELINKSPVYARILNEFSKEANHENQYAKA